MITCHGTPAPKTGDKHVVVLRRELHNFEKSPESERPYRRIVRNRFIRLSVPYDCTPLQSLSLLNESKNVINFNLEYTVSEMHHSLFLNKSRIVIKILVNEIDPRVYDKHSTPSFYFSILNSSNETVIVPFIVNWYKRFYETKKKVWREVNNNNNKISTLPYVSF